MGTLARASKAASKAAVQSAGARRAVLASAAVVSVALLGACAPPPGPPPDPGPPSIDSLRFVSERSRAPVVGVLRWVVSDPDSAVLTCRVDLDGDGTTDRVIRPCNSGDSVLVEIPAAKSRTATLEVDDADYAPVSTSVGIDVDPATTEGYEITLRLDAGMAPEFRQAFEDAAARWEEVVTAGVPDVALELPAGFLGWAPAFSGTVDDVLIDARDKPIDGPGNVLGSAGGILIRSGHWQPYYGIMEFDTADLAMLAGAGRLGDVILHEMGHVLGLGTSWTLQGRIADLLIDPGYNGQAGMAAWDELGGDGYVPVENEGGPGTALGHWRESVFGDELMTGYIGDDPAPLSRLTVAALADQGYGVDLGAADPYSLGSTALGSTAPLSAGPAGTVDDPHSWPHTDPIPPMLGGLPDR